MKYRPCAQLSYRIPEVRKFQIFSCVQAEEPEAGLTNPPGNGTPVSEFKKWNIALNVNILI